MKVKDDIDNILVSPRNFGSVLLINGNNIFFPTKLPHPSQIH